jgi:hypothetical protein
MIVTGDLLKLPKIAKQDSYCNSLAPTVSRLHGDVRAASAKRCLGQMLLGQMSEPGRLAGGYLDV